MFNRAIYHAMSWSVSEGWTASISLNGSQKPFRLSQMGALTDSRMRVWRTNRSRKRSALDS